MRNWVSVCRTIESRLFSSISDVSYCSNRSETTMQSELNEPLIEDAIVISLTQLLSTPLGIDFWFCRRDRRFDRLYILWFDWPLENSFLKRKSILHSELYSGGLLPTSLADLHCPKLTENWRFTFLVISDCTYSSTHLGEIWKLTSAVPCLRLMNTCTGNCLIRTILSIFGHGGKQFHATDTAKRECYWTCKRNIGTSKSPGREP